MTWEQIVSIEPRLKVLAERASRESNNASSDKCRLWNFIYKPELYKLVGWESRHKELKNPALFEIASRKICDILRY